MAELVAKRYAEALFQLSLEEQNQQEVKETLAAIEATLAAEKDFYQLIKSPLITPEEKKKMLEAVFHGRVMPMVLNFLYVLVDKRREGYLGEIIRTYGELLDTAQQVAEAVVVTAVPMGSEQLTRLQEQLVRSSGKSVHLVNQVDPEILGGVLVKMGEQVLDGTLRTQLKQIQEHLSKTIV